LEKGKKELREDSSSINHSDPGTGKTRGQGSWSYFKKEPDTLLAELKNPQEVLIASDLERGPPLD